MNDQRANEAMDKIRDEMAKTANEAVQEIGEAMTRLLLASPEMSDKIMAEDTRGADEIAQSINRIKAEVQEAVLDGAIRIGRELHAAKSKVPYGEWGAWLQTNVDYSTRMAQNLMRIADEYGRRRSEAMQGLSITQAVALLGLTAEQREAFVDEHDMESITTDQLQAEVRELRERARGDQQTIAQLMAEKDELMEEVASASCAKDDERVNQLTQLLRAAEERAKAAEAAAEAGRAAGAAGKAAGERAQREAAAAKQEAAELRTKLRAAQKDLEAVTAQKERTEEQLIEERTKAPQVVEKIPQEVEQEMARLRAAAGRSEDVQWMRVMFAQVGSMCDQMRARVDEMVGRDPETSQKLREVAAQLLQKQAEVFRA